jgi:hypothetical protein
MSARIEELSFRDVLWDKKRRGYKKSGDPLLQLQLLDSNTFHTVAELLFQHYLRDIRKEELYEHLWRFEPIIDGVEDPTKLPTDKPILIPMMTEEPFPDTFGSHVPKSKFVL